ncbi:MAG: hypothetical protein KKB34_04910 [Bacteroidetes bacterium]|nr:hypothetical protein [Bacteroidota bacterium]
MSYITPQEEIRNIMLKHGISYQWIAGKLSTYYQKVQYSIETQKEMPLSLYTEIIQIFEKHGYVENSISKCETLIELNFASNSKIGGELKKLNDQVIEDIKDRKFTPDERIKMRYRLEDIKKEFNQTFDNLIRLTYGDE